MKHIYRRGGWLNWANRRVLGRDGLALAALARPEGRLHDLAVPIEPGPQHLELALPLGLDVLQNVVLELLGAGALLEERALSLHGAAAVHFRARVG